MAITIKSLEERKIKLNDLCDKADKDYRKRDLQKQANRVARRLITMKKKAAVIEAAKAKAAEKKAEADAKAAEAAAPAAAE